MNEDPRIELINRMDSAAMAMNVVLAGALARLNWHLIDTEVLQFATNRVAQLQPSAAAPDRVGELRQKLATARSNYVIGQAAIAIGQSPSAFMTHETSTPSAPAVDPRFQLAALVQQMLGRAAMLKGAPDPSVAPALAARALDVLRDQVSLPELVQMVIAAAPPEQRGVLQAAAQTPLAAQLFAPIVRGSAVWAVPLDALAALAPEALIAGPPPASPAPAPVPRPSSNASLVDTLLAQAMADPDHADSLYVQAIDAAEKTPRIDDDIAVLRQIVQASGSNPASEAIVRRMAPLLAKLAPAANARDELAGVVVFTIASAFARNVVGDIGEELVAAARAVMAGGLQGAVAVGLAVRTAELLARLGKPADVTAVLDDVQKRTSDPQLLATIASTRVRLQPPAAATPSRSGLVPAGVRTALGNSLLWEDLRGDFTEARRRADGDVIATACVLAASGQARAARNLVEPIILAADTPRETKFAAAHVFRYAQRIEVQYVVGGAPYGDVYLTAMLKSLFPSNPTPSDPTTRADCQALVDFTGALTVRATVSTVGARNDADARAILQSLPSQLDGDATSQTSSASRSPAWLPLAAADLHRRDGDLVAARRFLEVARTVAANDVHALGEIALVEGHWSACSFESPLTLGLYLDGSPNPDSSIDDRVERREREVITSEAVTAATAAYDRAASAFRDAASPRGLAMVTLSRAGLAALTGDHDRAVTLGREAAAGFTAVGDELGQRLARTHIAIALTATGAPIERAGIQEIGSWCVGDGSVAFGIGCARLLSRSGRRALYRDGDIERALALHQLAYDLLAATPCDVLSAQALGDRATAFRLANDLDSLADALERASVQLEQATLGGPADLAPARAAILQQQWALENQRGSADGLDRVTARLPGIVAQLDTALQTTATAELLTAKLQLTKTSQIAPTVSALYRARDLETDPDSTPEQRTAGWQAAIDLAHKLSNNDALLYEGLARAGHGDDEGASTVFQQLFDAPDVTQTVPGAERLPFAIDVKIRGRIQALACFLRAKDIPRARAAYDQLVALDPEWVKREEQPWNVLANVAALRLAEGDRVAALEVSDQAIGAVESRRSRLTEDALKRGFVDTSPIHAMFVGAARACLDTDPARAFSFVERGRARALLDLASDRRVGSTPWRAYNARRDLLFSLLAVERTKPAPDAARIAALEGELATLKQPDAAERPILDPTRSIATLDAIAAGLPEGTVLLEYAFADDFLVAWAIARSGMGMRRAVPIRTGELRRNAFAFRDACATSRDTTGPGRALADLLLEPFADAIRGASQVVIVPSDALHVVPFHALPFGGRQLVDAVAVSYAPSASLVLDLGRGAIAAGGLLAVGNPADMAFRDDDGVSRALPQLPGAGVEVKRIVASYPNARGLVGADATLAEVRDRLREAKIVHLATHGIVSSQSPWLSTIALAHRDGLDLATMQSLDLDADLITLSACDTASGTIGRNDEVVGFARGLIAAGARRAVTSLWAVNDAATCELMTAFYRELAAGKPVAQALRAAQIHVRDLSTEQVRALVLELDTDIARDLKGLVGPRPPAYAHPRFWAPFVLIGL